MAAVLLLMFAGRRIFALCFAAAVLVIFHDSTTGG